MESAARDLSTASGAAVMLQRQPAAPSVTEEDGGVDASVMSAMAKEAAMLFQSRKYDECLELLHQLLQKKTGDPKVLHNIAIVEFFRDDCSDPKKLLYALDNVKRTIQELAGASLEQADTASISGNKGASVSKGSSTLDQQLGISINNAILYSDEFDVSVASLNTAVLWFHLHEYGKALSVLEPLYDNIGPLDENVALPVWLLILDAALARPDAKKAMDMLNYLEKALCVSQGGGGSMALQQSANLVAKPSTVLNSSLLNEGSNLESSLVSSEKALSRTLSEETLDYETMLSALDIGGQETSRTSYMPSSNDPSRSPISKSISVVDFKLKLQLYRVRFLLLTGNLKGAKREVKGAMNVVRGRDSSTALLLKAQLEYARRNYRKAMKLLMALGNRMESGISGLLFNNLGCVYQQMKKYHLAAILHTKALSSFSSIRKEKPLKLSSFSQDKSLYIMYNCGLQYLASGKPILAARCLQKAHSVFYDRPIFWFRLAECCIVAWEKGFLRPGNFSDCSATKLYVIGKGKWRRLAVKNSLRDGSEEDIRANDISPAGDEHMKLSLEFARVCLFNALYLVNQSESIHSDCSALPLESCGEGLESTGSVVSNDMNHKVLTGGDNKSMMAGFGPVTANGDVKEQKGGGIMCQELTNCSLSVNEDTIRRRTRILKQAIVANQAYVELELENPLDALSSALTLLQLPDCSKVYAYLGRVYAAEALCFMNRAKDAAAQLSIFIAEGGRVELPYAEEDLEQWQTAKVFDSDETNDGPKTTPNFSLEDVDVDSLQILNPEEARATLYVNLAVKSALEGEYELALQLVTRALAVIPTSREAALTAVYAHLMMGSTQHALSNLKQLTNARFLLYNFMTHVPSS
ncbi:hypothetical protein MLD38_014423 [Melastoma candidum]|uniref:Uncharacterized protein n=1 Tax=Melastoma candidum TaxID=119954 RepID=A0ACB9RL60_9MYRT|nr:hypothetical protein MLD38_014423 [Melastoma candidum]